MMKKRTMAQNIILPVTIRDFPRQESQEELLPSSSTATNSTTAPKERKSVNPSFWRLSRHREESIEEEEEHDDAENDTCSVSSQEAASYAKSTMEGNCSSPPTTKSNKEAKSHKRRTIISSPASVISPKCISNILLSPAGKYLGFKERAKVSTQSEQRKNHVRSSLYTCLDEDDDTQDAAFDRLMYLTTQKSNQFKNPKR
jgi:hypothetical protein